MKNTRFTTTMAAVAALLFSLNTHALSEGDAVSVKVGNTNLGTCLVVQNNALNNLQILIDGKKYKSMDLDSLASFSEPVFNTESKLTAPIKVAGSSGTTELGGGHGIITVGTKKIAVKRNRAIPIGIVSDKQFSPKHDYPCFVGELLAKGKKKWNRPSKRFLTAIKKGQFSAQHDQWAQTQTTSKTAKVGNKVAPTQKNQRTYRPGDRVDIQIGKFTLDDCSVIEAAGMHQIQLFVNPTAIPDLAKTKRFRLSNFNSSRPTFNTFDLTPNKNGSALSINGAETNIRVGYAFGTLSIGGDEVKISSKNFFFVGIPVKHSDDSRLRCLIGYDLANGSNGSATGESHLAHNILRGTYQEGYDTWKESQRTQTADAIPSGL